MIRELARKRMKMGSAMDMNHVTRFVSSVASQCPRADHRQMNPQRTEQIAEAA